MEPIGWGERLRSAGYNLKYRALSYLEESGATNILRNHEDGYLSGKKYEARENLPVINKAIYEEFQRVPWMTYRAGFPQLRVEHGEGYVSDTGWGCMIRVGQMFAAHALVRFSKPTNKQQYAPVLELFSDYDREQMFSIQNIVQLARQDYDLLPGKWYNPSQISYIISDLFRQRRNRRQFRGFDFLVLNNATLFYDQLVMKMTGRREVCTCPKPKVVCKDCYKLQQSVAVILLSRIGLEHPEKKYLKVLNLMMQSRLFLGVIGGKPQKALYFMGRINDNYIYLDPHMVQQGVGPHNFRQSFDSYFCHSFRTCRNSAIDPSIGIGFYLETLQDLDDFYDDMSRIKEDNPQDFFLFSNLETPEYMRNQQSEQPQPSGFIDIQQAQ